MCGDVLVVEVSVVGYFGVDSNMFFEGGLQVDVQFGGNIVVFMLVWVVVVECSVFFF